MSKVQRIEIIDFARGLALVAMTIFHFAFDLELFGVQEPGVISQPHWKYFARSIATSFLFLAGFSLYLAHFNAIKWTSWRWRMLKIVTAAMVITIATYFVTPGQYIFFGILHAIAFASVVGLFFLHTPVAVTLTAAGLIFGIGMNFETTLLNHRIWWWTGLSEIRIVSSDYVPVFPWFSAPLIGIAAAKFTITNGLINTLAELKLNSSIARLFKFIGRNSLAYYLLHQPVMIAGLLSFLYLTGQSAF